MQSFCEDSDELTAHNSEATVAKVVGVTISGIGTWFCTRSHLNVSSTSARVIPCLRPVKIAGCAS